METVSWFAWAKSVFRLLFGKEAGNSKINYSR